MTGDKEGLGGLPEALEEDRPPFDQLLDHDLTQSPMSLSESIEGTQSGDSVDSLELYSNSVPGCEFNQDAYRTYKPLEQGEIRILIPLSGKNEEPTQCATSRVVLDSKPMYDAISYTWDTSSNDFVHISLNGETRLTPPNLVHRLYNLRYEDAPRAFWIDAICTCCHFPSVLATINQIAIKLRRRRRNCNSIKSISSLLQLQSNQSVRSCLID